MKEIDQNNLDAAIALGDAVCEELGICCDKRGRVIFQIYKKLEELKPKGDSADKPEPGEAQVEQDANRVTSDQKSYIKYHPHHLQRQQLAF